MTEKERIEKFALKPGEYVIDKDRGNRLYSEKSKDESVGAPVKEKP